MSISFEDNDITCESLVVNVDGVDIKDDKDGSVTLNGGTEGLRFNNQKIFTKKLTIGGETKNTEKKKYVKKK